jgi:hypothetical protein
MIFRTAGGKAKNGMISCHARRYEGAIEGYFWPHCSATITVRI